MSGNSRRQERSGFRARTMGSLLAVAVAAGGACAPHTHEEAEEDHEHPSVVVTQWNDSTELFLEYPHVVAGQATGNWAIHLSSMKDFRPIVEGQLTVRFVPVQGEGQVFTLEAPARDGIFLLDPVVENPGSYEVVLELESPQVRGRHSLDVRVHASADRIPHEEEEEDGGIVFLKEQQWQIDWAIASAVGGEINGSVVVPAEVVPADGALVEVTSPVDGILPVTGNRDAPSVGERVRRGQVLAQVDPVASEASVARILGRAEQLQEQVDRLRPLAEAGAVPRRRLLETEHDLEIALAEARAAGFDPEAGVYRLPVTAPMDGVVGERFLVPGQQVAAGTRLFTLLDPDRLWIRGRLPVRHLVELVREEGAVVLPSGGGTPMETGVLLAAGQLVDPDTRTIPVTYPLASGPGVAVGQLVQLRIPVGATTAGLIVPSGALVDDNGTPVVYVQVGGESFERRIVRVGPSDGLRTLLLSGVVPGEMVVTRGAPLVRMASMAGGEFAGSHAH
jgi:membrane fusion protein, heavy metal efflux system